MNKASLSFPILKWVIKAGQRSNTPHYFCYVLGARARKQAVEQIENNIKWLENHKDTILNWLNQNQNKT